GLPAARIPPRGAEPRPAPARPPLRHHRAAHRRGAPPWRAGRGGPPRQARPLPPFRRGTARHAHHGRHALPDVFQHQGRHRRRALAAGGGGAAPLLRPPRHAHPRIRRAWEGRHHHPAAAHPPGRLPLGDDPGRMLGRPRPAAAGGLRLHPGMDPGQPRALPPDLGPLGRRSPDRGDHRPGLPRLHPRADPGAARPRARGDHRHGGGRPAPRRRDLRPAAGGRLHPPRGGEHRGPPRRRHPGRRRLRHGARHGGLLPGARPGRHARRHPPLLPAHDRVRDAQPHRRPHRRLHGNPDASRPRPAFPRRDAGRAGPRHHRPPTELRPWRRRQLLLLGGSDERRLLRLPLQLPADRGLPQPAHGCPQQPRPRRHPAGL
ncbi:MAG: hypothetical protein AVDCRST_MAG27-4480, partial [uncultured Craurococcus sp.]